MALAFRITNSEDFGRLFASYDEYSSIVNMLFGRALSPSDDYYTAPYAFMPGGEVGGFVVMTCRVPWLHGHGNLPDSHHDKGTWREQYFAQALDIMTKCDMFSSGDDIPKVEAKGAEYIQMRLDLEEREVFTFTNDGCYPTEDDDIEELEDNAVIITCGAMGWELPFKWREERERENGLRCNAAQHFRDKAKKKGNDNEMDISGNSAKKRMRYSALIPPSLEGGNHSEEQQRESEQPQLADAGEEKKDSYHDPQSELQQLPVLQHEREVQQQQQLDHQYAVVVSHEDDRNNGGHTPQLGYGYEQDGNMFFDEDHTLIGEEGHHFEDEDNWSHEYGYYGPQEYQQQMDGWVDNASRQVEENNEGRGEGHIENVEI